MESVSVARGRIDKGQPTVEIARRKRQGLQKHGRVEKTQGATGFRSTEQGQINQQNLIAGSKKQIEGGNTQSWVTKATTQG